MVARRFCLIVGLLAIVLTAAVEKLAFAATPADSPQGLWANYSPPGDSANTAAAAVPPAESSGPLWPNSATPDTGANNPAGANSLQGLWGEDAAKTETLPSVAPSPAQTPSQAFWASVGRGYQAITPLGYKEYPGFPGWGPAVPFQPTESCLYTRLDYYHWTEHYHGANILVERGPLYTVGYTLTGGEQRLRLEFFAGGIQYIGGTTGGAQYYAIDSRATYYGGRIEYDLFFNLPNHPNGLLFLGLGTRVWERKLPDAALPGNLSAEGYRETWATLYPYIGLETRHNPARVSEFYGRMRVGLTAYTYERHVANDDPSGDASLAPRVGGTALLEEGYRYHGFSATIWTEIFGFSQSHVVNSQLQPTSTLLTVGVKAGYSF